MRISILSLLTLIAILQQQQVRICRADDLAAKLQTYCVDCHNSDVAEGELNFESLPTCEQRTWRCGRQWRKPSSLVVPKSISLWQRACFPRPITVSTTIRPVAMTKRWPNWPGNGRLSSSNNIFDSIRRIGFANQCRNACKSVWAVVQQIWCWVVVFCC